MVVLQVGGKGISLEIEMPLGADVSQNPILELVRLWKDLNP